MRGFQVLRIGEVGVDIGQLLQLGLSPQDRLRPIVLGHARSNTAHEPIVACPAFATSRAQLDFSMLERGAVARAKQIALSGLRSRLLSR